MSRINNYLIKQQESDEEKAEMQAELSEMQEPFIEDDSKQNKEYIDNQEFICSLDSVPF